MTGVWVANDDGTEIVRARDISVASLDYDGNVNVRLAGADGVVGYDGEVAIAHRAEIANLDWHEPKEEASKRARPTFSGDSAASVPRPH